MPFTLVPQGSSSASYVTSHLAGNVFTPAQNDVIVVSSALIPGTSVSGVTGWLNTTFQLIGSAGEIYVWAARVGASPGSGQANVSFSASVSPECTVSVISGINVSAALAAVFVQNSTISAYGLTSPAPFPALAAFIRSSNLSFNVVSLGTTSVPFTAQAGFTLLSSSGVEDPTPNREISIFYQTSEQLNQTATHVNDFTYADLSGIAFEIDEEVGGGAGITITTPPSAVERGETGVTIGVSSATAQGAGSSVTYNGQTCAITAWPVGTGNIVVDIPAGLTGLYSGTGYAFIVTDDDTTTDTSALVPLNVPAGYAFINTVNPLFATNAYGLFGFNGTPDPVSTDQFVYQTQLQPETGISLTPDPDTRLIISGPTSQVNTTLHSIVRAATGAESTQWTITYPLNVPVLTLPTGAANGQTASTGTVSTDTPIGTLYHVLTQFANQPTALQIQNGQDHLGNSADSSGNQTVNSSGTKNYASSGLTAGTTYFYHSVQTSTVGDSLIASSPSFQTDAAGVVSPVVNAGGPYSGDSGSIIALTATVTPGTDPNPTYLWTIVSGGTGTFVNATTLTPTFSPDSVSTYILRLTASTTDAADVTSDATLTSNAVAATVNAQGPYSGIVGQPIQLTILINVGTDPNPTLFLTADDAGVFLPDDTDPNATFTPTNVNPNITITATVSSVDSPNQVDTATLASSAGAAVISAPTAVETGSTTSTGTFDTDTTGGIVYWVESLVVTQPTGTQIKAGQDGTGNVPSNNAPVPATGTISGLNTGGLTASTPYWRHYVQDNGQDSNIITAASYTTNAPPVAGQRSPGVAGIYQNIIRKRRK